MWRVVNTDNLFFLFFIWKIEIFVYITIIGVGLFFISFAIFYYSKIHIFLVFASIFYKIFNVVKIK